jgi:hypothetical protein
MCSCRTWGERLRPSALETRLPAHLEHDDLRRALRRRERHDPKQMPLHLVSFRCVEWL